MKGKCNMLIKLTTKDIIDAIDYMYSKYCSEFGHGHLYLPVRRGQIAYIISQEPGEIGVIINKNSIGNNNPTYEQLYEKWIIKITKDSIITRYNEDLYIGANFEFINELYQIFIRINYDRLNEHSSQIQLNSYTKKGDEI